MKRSRQPIIAGNWKMNMLIEDTKDLASRIVSHTREKSIFSEVIIFPPFTSLDAAKYTLKGSAVKLGAQDLFWKESGAYTGEISPLMLRDAGCSHVLTGHSERRHIIGENDEIVCNKTINALKHNLTPIICVGETNSEYESGQTKDILERQINSVCEQINVNDFERVIIAYEPVWAIGTGKNADSNDAQESIKFIRDLISSITDDDKSQKVRILYGGSVKADNIEKYVVMPDIDGVLVGGASLKLNEFCAMIDVVEKNHKTL